MIFVTKRCPNCNQIVLPDDTRCWHCETALAAVPPAAAPAAAMGLAQAERDWRRSMLGLRGGDALPTSTVPPVAVYAPFTLLLLVAAVWLAGQLRAYPLVQLPPSERIPPAWQVLTVGENELTLNVPESWVVADAAVPAQQSDIAAFMSQPMAPTFFQPLASRGPDLAVRLLAQGVPLAEGNMAERPLLILASSELLAPLTTAEVEQTAEMATDITDITLLQTFHVDNYQRSHDVLVVRMGDWRCYQHFANGRQRAWLLALCAPDRDFIQWRETFEQISNSFEDLQREIVVE